MKNNIEYFLSGLSRTKTYMFKENPINQATEVYVLITSDVLLLISKETTNVVLKQSISDMVNINLEASSMIINTKNISFCLQDKESQSKAAANSKISENLNIESNVNTRGLVYDKDRYPNLHKCETCLNKRCMQYDMLKVNTYKISGITVSEEMLRGHDLYCREKIAYHKCNTASAGGEVRIGIYSRKIDDREGISM